MILILEKPCHASLGGLHDNFCHRAVNTKGTGGAAATPPPLSDQLLNPITTKGQILRNTLLPHPDL